MIGKCQIKWLKAMLRHCLRGWCMLSAPSLSLGLHGPEPRAQYALTGHAISTCGCAGTGGARQARRPAKARADGTISKWQTKLCNRMLPVRLCLRGWCITGAPLASMRRPATTRTEGTIAMGRTPSHNEQMAPDRRLGLHERVAALVSGQAAPNKRAPA